VTHFGFRRQHIRCRLADCGGRSADRASRELNMGRMANKNKFKDLITAPQARDQIVNYCNFRPGDAFYQAVMDVYDGFLDADP
jgi:hypothetical protein